jgi:hypothetical protein
METRLAHQTTAACCSLPVGTSVHQGPSTHGRQYRGRCQVSYHLRHTMPTLVGTICGACVACNGPAVAHRLSPRHSHHPCYHRPRTLVHPCYHRHRPTSAAFPSAHLNVHTAHSTPIISISTSISISISIVAAVVVVIMCTCFERGLFPHVCEKCQARCQAAAGTWSTPEREQRRGCTHRHVCWATRSSGTRQRSTAITTLAVGGRPHQLSRAAGSGSAPEWRTKRRAWRCWGPAAARLHRGQARR